MKTSTFKIPPPPLLHQAHFIYSCLKHFFCTTLFTNCSRSNCSLCGLELILTGGEGCGNGSKDTVAKAIRWIGSHQSTAPFFSSTQCRTYSIKFYLNFTRGQRKKNSHLSSSAPKPMLGLGSAFPPLIHICQIIFDEQSTLYANLLLEEGRGKSCSIFFSVVFCPCFFFCLSFCLSFFRPRLATTKFGQARLILTYPSCRRMPPKSERDVMRFSKEKRALIVGEGGECRMCNQRRLRSSVEVVFISILPAIVKIEFCIRSPLRFDYLKLLQLRFNDCAEAWAGELLDSLFFLISFAQCLKG